MTCLHHMACVTWVVSHGLRHMACIVRLTLQSSAGEQVQDKVLSLSLDQTVSQELSHTSCSSCGASVYEAALLCSSCQHTFEACCVSGETTCDASTPSAALTIL